MKLLEQWEETAISLGDIRDQKMNQAIRQKAVDEPGGVINVLPSDSVPSPAANSS